MENLANVETKLEESHKTAVGKANLEASKAKAGGLSALGKTEEGNMWLDALAPKDDEEGVALDEQLNDILTNPGLFTDILLFKDFQMLLRKTNTFYAKRIKTYDSVLTHETHGVEATAQLCTLVGVLESLLERGYAQVFETWVVLGDKYDLDKWSAWAEETRSYFKDEDKVCQIVTEMGMCYKLAYDPKLRERYEAFFRNVATKTGGVFTPAPMKTPLRAVEKTAFTHDAHARWKCEHIYDVLRGSIAYPSMAGIKRGAEMICNSEDFEALLLTDRFTTDGKEREEAETSSSASPPRPKVSSKGDGWKYAVLHGRFDGFNSLVLEIRLDHDKLASIREDVEGHCLYSVRRSLVEALAVVYGDERAQSLLAKHDPRLLLWEAESRGRWRGNEDHAEEADRLNAEIDRLREELHRVKAHARAQTEALEALNHTLRAELRHAREDVERLHQQSSDDDRWLLAPEEEEDDHHHWLALFEWVQGALLLVSEQQQEQEDAIDTAAAVTTNFTTGTGTTTTTTTTSTAFTVVVEEDPWEEDSAAAVAATTVNSCTGTRLPHHHRRSRSPRCEPRHPRSKEDLLALRALRLHNPPAQGCGISGPLPAELGQLAQLQVLNLAWNNLTGITHLP
jgi:hypothetical protein